jgi:uncharacterized protein (DUF697 family)
MTTKKQRINQVIHGFSAACGLVGGGLAQIAGSDAPAICSLQATMIAAIADEHGVKVSKAAAADFLLTFVARAAGRAVSQALIGWLPGLGNIINAATAIALTESIGWAANEHFSKEEPKPA